MSPIQRLVNAIIAIINGGRALKAQVAALKAQLVAEQALNADLKKQVDANGGLSDALKKSQDDLVALRAQNQADTDAASGEVDAAEAAVADIHADPDIPVTVNPDGTAVPSGDVPSPTVPSDNTGAPQTPAPANP